MVDAAVRTERDNLFRITSCDASHQFLDGKMVIASGGMHGPAAKMVPVKLQCRQHRLTEFEVQ